MKRLFIPFLLLLCSHAAFGVVKDSAILNTGYALKVFDDLESSGNYIEDLTPEGLTQLPVGQKRTLNNVQYTTGITAVKFTPEYAEFTAFLRIKIPQQSGKVKDLFFGASGIKLSRSGGIIGDVKLALLGDFPIDMGNGKLQVILKGSFDQSNNMINGGEPVTFARIDCKGFKELSINADAVFSRDLLLPTDKEGVVLPQGQVRGNFKTVAGDWNDILAEISLPDFQINGVNDFTFSVDKAVFDFSDIRNSPQAVFPSKYMEQYMLPGNDNLWRGVYISSVKVTLPKLFSKKSDTKRVTLEGRNLLIDNMGFSGLVTASNIIPIEEGAAGTWPISIDRFSLDIVANKLTGAGFGGTIKLPVDEKTQLKYDALISPGNEYLLTVQPKDTVSFNFIRASNVTLYPNSSIELRVKDDKFLPKAILHGKLTINASLKKDAPMSDDGLGKLADIEFRGLELQTVSPKIKIASFGYNGEIRIGNFPASINNIEITASNDEARLSFGIDVHLLGEGQGGFKGDAQLEIIGKLAQNSGLDSWKFDRIKLDKIGINFDKGGVELHGNVFIFEDDPTYGKGFAGDISMKLKKLNLEVSAKALFGRTTEFRYWYADAFAKLGAAGIPIFAGLKINGLGGGAYEKMKLAGRVPKGTTGIGVTPTGYLYVPDAQTNFAFKAIVGFGSQDPQSKVVNGQVTLEMAFSAGGGLRYIHFEGMAQFIKELPLDKFDKLEKNLEKLTFNDEQGKAQYEADRKALSNESALTAVAVLDVDFENNSLHGVFELYLSAGPLKGAGQGNLAGSVVMHYEPGMWYIHIGRPDSRIGIKFGLGPIQLKVGAYLMVGNEIPASPPPPAIIANILGVELSELDYMRDLNALGNGSGFAFGADLSFTTGDLTFLIFYARFDAGLGFDIMLKDYGKDTHCKGSDEPIGINGWYANGQAYVYLQGDVGLTFKLFGKRKKISILKIGVAVLMQAKLPNPFWFRGYVGGYYSVLGGMIKGRCNFKVQLGSECEIVDGGPLNGLKVISDIAPGEGSTEVDVFAAPQAVFNMALEKEMELDDESGNYKKYRIKLDKFQVLKDGTAIDGTLKWNDRKDGVAFYSHEILPPHASLKAIVAVTFEELVGGSWRPVMENGAQAVETKEITFTTGVAPESIPLSNIQYSYPVIDQQHYYVDEYANGFVQLKRGQSYLFNASTGWKQELRFKSNGQTQLTSMSYDPTKNLLSWKTPVANRKASYTLELVNLPPAATAGGKVKEQYENTNIGDQDVQVRNNKADGVATNVGAEEKMLLTYNFGTSEFGTFAQKVNAATITKIIREPIYIPDVHALQVFTSPVEVYDQQELVGTDYTDSKSLIHTEAILDGEAYFQQDVKPLIYDNYPYNNMVTFQRTEGQQTIPVWAIYPIESYLLNPDASRLPFRYHLPKQYKSDLSEIQRQLSNAAIRTPLPTSYHTVLNALFPIIRQGTYKMKLTYVLPNGMIGSSVTIQMYNPIQ
ncbi:MAG: hypothetical protein JO154_05665 [Chitinophaga sp.]|uniref:hypothetical protein n=1 Tax=Chitinophaga sp. TaxID=1869181 RepID=UPI0025BD729E|nr:hypothetical protein [Chitinophaga sp.]MBV8252076.1 hypothetical protein [Chitinophaga sp.]